MTRTAGIVLAALLALPSAARAGEAEDTLRIEGFSLHREKIGAIAVAQATLVNGGERSEGPFDAVLQVLDSYALVKE